MFGLGFVEILVILAVVLIVVGPDKLPEFSRTLGRTMWQLRRTADEFKREVNLSSLGVDPEMLRSEFNEIRGIADNCPDNPKNIEPPTEFVEKDESDVTAESAEESENSPSPDKTPSSE